MGRRRRRKREEKGVFWRRRKRTSAQQLLPADPRLVPQERQRPRLGDQRPRRPLRLGRDLAHPAVHVAEEIPPRDVDEDLRGAPRDRRADRLHAGREAPVEAVAVPLPVPPVGELDAAAGPHAARQRPAGEVLELSAVRHERPRRLLRRKVHEVVAERHGHRGAGGRRLDGISPVPVEVGWEVGGGELLREREVQQVRRGRREAVHDEPGRLLLEGARGGGGVEEPL